MGYIRETETEFIVYTDDNKIKHFQKYNSSFAVGNIYGEQDIINDTTTPPPSPTIGKFEAPLPRECFNWYTVDEADYGPRTLGKKWHDGIDLGSAGATYGRPIRAAADGVVQNTWTNNWAHGNGVLLSHGVIPGGGEYSTAPIWTDHWHMSVRYVSVGDKVKLGDVIGLIGATGQAFGAHLHWEVHFRTYGNYTNSYSGSTVDPFKVVEAFGNKWQSLLPLR